MPSGAIRGQPPLQVGDEEGNGYADVYGFCKSTSMEEVRKHGHALTPIRYVGVELQEDDGERFEDRMKQLDSAHRDQQAEDTRLDSAITAPQH